MSEEIKFKVGDKYENMKGIYEVVAIHKDSMDIRWEDGEVIETPIALQKRIIERMRFEKDLEEARKAQKAKKAKAKASKGGKQFLGLEESDFTNSVSKTTWRGRGQIGGAVATRIKSKHFKFNSWAVLRKPEVSWMDINRQKQDDVKLQATFYARVEETGLCYGIHIPSPDPEQTVAYDWQIFLSWLKKEENVNWLAKQCSSHSLRICDLTQKGFVGTVEYKDGQWVHMGASQQEKIVESLQSFLDAASKSGAISLRIERKTEKSTVIEKKQDIALDIAALIESFMPLYVAVATLNS